MHRRRPGLSRVGRLPHTTVGRACVDSRPVRVNREALDPAVDVSRPDGEPVAADGRRGTFRIPAVPVRARSLPLDTQTLDVVGAIQPRLAENVPKNLTVVCGAPLEKPAHLAG